MSSEMRVGLNRLQEAVNTALQSLDEADFATRFWKKDPGLWQNSSDVANNLGWLEVARTMRTRVGDLLDFATTIRTEGYTHVVLLGMGGSSLGPEVLRRTFGTVGKAPELVVLDSIDPAYIQQIEDSVNLKRTIFIVSSQSGMTLEPHLLLTYFFEKIHALKGNAAGENFVAITDPGTALEKHARDLQFREVFLNATDLGGRYGVLSYIGLVPAALAGYNIQEMLARAIEMAAECRKPGLDNPGLYLGAILGATAKEGRNKATLILPEVISSFGLWAEQLLAESTGKDGLGIVPVANEALGAPGVYGNDRLFIYFKVEGYDAQDTEVKLKRLEEAGHPVVRLHLNDMLDVAAEFFRWQFAVAVAASLLGVNPFDQPNSTESKDNTLRLLAQYKTGGELPPITNADGHSLKEVLATIVPGSYVALLAYILPSEASEAALQEIRLMVRDHFKVATTTGYGPRYIYATGQLHKGGPDNGVFIQIVSPDPTDLSIPGAPYSFSILKQAQAQGDFEALQKHGRRITYLETKLAASAATLAEVKRLIQTVLAETNNQSVTLSQTGGSL